jgi:hypothetical protein
MPRSLRLQVLVGTKRSTASVAAARRGALFLDRGQLVTVVAIPSALLRSRVNSTSACSSWPYRADPTLLHPIPRVCFASRETLWRLCAFPVADAAA